MTTVCGAKVLTAGDIRQRAEKWNDWDEVRLICGEKCFLLELGINLYADFDWTGVADFRLLLDEMADDEPLRFRQNGKSVVVVGVEDEGEPFLCRPLAYQPDELRLYRGYNKGKGLGWSWTLSEEKAIWFAHRFETPDRRPRLLVGTAWKKNAIAYIGFRGEEEILINPTLVAVLEKRKVTTGMV